MKKIITLGAFAMFGMIAFTSCQKEFTCDCVDSSGNYTVETHKGKDATDACNNGTTITPPKACSPA